MSVNCFLGLVLHNGTVVALERPIDLFTWLCVISASQNCELAMSFSASGVEAKYK